MSYIPCIGPEPGQATKDPTMADSQTEIEYSASALSRDGRYLESIVAYHAATRQKYLARLDRTLERISNAAEKSRDQIAQGQATWALSEVKSEATTLVELIGKLESATEALQDAEITARCAKEDKSARGAKGRLDEAAAAIESRDPGFAALIRERAQVHLDAEQAEIAAAAAARAVEREAEKAKRNARPLGKVELEVLADLYNTEDAIPRSWSARRNKALDSLVERGFLALTPGANKSDTKYRATDAGLQAKVR